MLEDENVSCLEVVHDKLGFGLPGLGLKMVGCFG